jgi:hypothetical protein
MKPILLNRAPRPMNIINYQLSIINYQFLAGRPLCGRLHRRPLAVRLSACDLV